jgi:hypothetical protein
MIIISHRGNLYGPNSTYENSQDAIEYALRCGYHVEIDLWHIYDDDLYLGHTHPEHNVAPSFLKSNMDRLWIHCKNLGAMDWCITHKMTHAFSHDRDDYVFTTSSYVWRYPNHALNISANTIVCLPENCELETIPDTCAGICTDYPCLYSPIVALESIRCTPSLLSISSKYSPIYKEMISRQKKNVAFPCTYDPHVWEELESHCPLRFCYALTTMIDIPPQLEDVIETFHRAAPGHLIYKSKPTIPQEGHLHITWMQMASFSHYMKEGLSSHDVATICSIARETWHTVPCFDVLFFRALLLPQGIVLLGIPTFDINTVRQHYREELQSYNLIHEPYKSNIVHATCLRFTHPITTAQQEQLKQLTEIPFLFRVSIQDAKIGKSTWSMTRLPAHDLYISFSNHAKDSLI